MWIMWITWCISPILPQNKVGLTVDNFLRTKVLFRKFGGKKVESLCILSKGPVEKSEEKEKPGGKIKVFYGN